MVVNVSCMNLNLTALLPGHDWADCLRQWCKLAAPVSFLCNWMKWQGVVHFLCQCRYTFTDSDLSHDVIAVVHVTEASVRHPPETKGCKTAPSDGCWRREDIWRCLMKWCIITLSRCSPSRGCRGTRVCLPSLTSCMDIWDDGYVNMEFVCIGIKMLTLLSSSRGVCESVCWGGPCSFQPSVREPISI